LSLLPPESGKRTAPESGGTAESGLWRAAGDGFVCFLRSNAYKQVTRKELIV